MTDVHAIEYWRLPHAKEQGEISTLAYEPLAASGVTDALKAGLSQMLDETTPFLAMPENIRDYDGISRYDEWAGE